MATNTQDVELRIRATNLSKQTTDKVVSSLNELTKAQDAQIESAKKGATTAAALEASYTKIENAAKALVSQSGLIKLFEAQSKAAEESNTRLEAARNALTAYANSLDPAASKTRAQETQLKALSRALAGAEKAYAAIQNRVTTTSERLAQFGISTSNLADSQSKISTAVNNANVALERQERTIDSLTLRQSRLKTAEDARTARDVQARVDAQFAAAQNQIAVSLAAEAKAQREANQASQDANRERQVAVDVAFANAQRDAAEAINKKTAALNAQNAALRAAADQAERQVRATGGVTRGTAPITTANLAGTIRDIGDPAAAALRSVGGLETAVASLETRVTSLNGPVKGYKQALQEAAAAQQALQAIAGRVDAYNNQIAALRAARAEYTGARSAVNALIAEMRSGAAGDDVTTRLARAQGVLASAAAQMGNLTTATRATRDSLTRAGVDTANLTQAEAQLVEQARRAGSAVTALNTAYQQHGAAVERSTSAMSSWFGGGRTTLSYAQRIRGELLALATAYVGLNAAIELGKGSLETYGKFQALQSRLLVASGGDAKAAADEFAYLTAVSDKFGFVLLDIGNAYAKFAIAGKAANFTTQETRYIFENFAKAARNARLSTAEFEGILKAVEQMMSKGTIQAEELRGQLGDRLPGAFAIAAKSAGKTTAEYAKMLELGHLGSEEVLNIAKGVGEAYGKIGSGAETLNQAQARFQNATDKFKEAIAEKGFAAAYQEFLAKLTAIISGESGDKLATKLAAAFKAILDIIILLIDHVDELKLGLEIILGLKLVEWAFGAVSAIKLLGVEFKTLNLELRAIATAGIAEAMVAIGAGAGTAATGIGIATGAVALLRTGITLLLRAIPYVGIALTAWSVLSFAWDKFFNKDEAAKAGAAAGKAGAKAVADTPVPPKRDTSYDVYAKTIDEEVKLEAKLEQERLDILRQGAKKNLAERLKFVDQTYDVNREQARETIKDKTALELRLDAIQRLSDKDQANERLRYNNEQATLGETAAKKRERLALEIGDKLKEIEADNAKRAAEQGASTEPYEKLRAARIDAIGKAYDEVGRKIKELGAISPKDAAAAAIAEKQLAILKAQQEVQTGITSDREQAVRLEKEFTDKQEIQKEQLNAINTLYETGQITAAQQLERMNAVVSETGPGIEEAGKKALEFADNVRSMLDPVMYQRLIATIGQGMAKASVDATVATNNLNATQTQLNQTLERRAELDEKIKTMRKLGIIDSEKEADLLNRNADEYKVKVDDLIKSLRLQLETAHDLGAVSDEAYAKQKAAIDGLSLSTDNAIKSTTDLENTIVNSLVQNASTAFETLAGEIGKVATGAESIGEGFRNALRTAGQFFASLLRDIAAVIAKQLILNAISSFFGASSGIGAAAIQAGGTAAAKGQHTGGITGMNASFTRRVDASIFAGAPKYHTGGLAGLQANEVPAILQKNEEVLTRNDPRHVLNGGMNNQSGAGNRFVLVDDRSKVAEAMQSAEGEKVTLVHLRRNLPTLKQWLK